MFNKIKNFFKKKESNKNVKKVNEGHSSITFEIDPELFITVKSKVNSEIIETLIDSDYLRPEQSEDENAIHLAFVLIANETTEQIIEEINEKASKLTD